MNADKDGHPIRLIYKHGDDLRQDMLTLQLISLMNKIWLTHADLDLKMSPYAVIATGKNTGMIEVVLHSETVSSIQLVTIDPSISLLLLLL
jgi:phosphatidylinositol kinase/protein kinase (PI-3  family)